MNLEPNLPPGTIVTTPFPDIEGNVAERTSDGHWLITGEEGLYSDTTLSIMADAPFVVIRRGY